MAETQMLDIDPDGKLTALEGSLADSKTLMMRVGMNLLSRAQRAFREQKRGGNAWYARMVPNVPGVVSDLNAGRMPAKRRFVSGPALRDTGLLLRSLSAGGPSNKFVATRHSVEVGTTVPYATLHQGGGTSLVRLQRSGRKNLAKFLRKNKEHRASLGWLFSRGTFSVRIGARPFLGFDAQDLREFQEELRDWLDEMMD